MVVTCANCGRKRSAAAEPCSCEALPAGGTEAQQPTPETDSLPFAEVESDDDEMLRYAREELTRGAEPSAPRRPGREARTPPPPRESDAAEQPSGSGWGLVGLVPLGLGPLLMWAGLTGPGFLIAVVGVLWLLIWAAIRSKRAKKKRLKAGEKPYRSRFLGAVLKCLGVALLVGVFMANMTDAADTFWSKNTFSAWKLTMLLYAAGTGLVFRGYQLSVRTFDPGDHPDERPPILYLRGFETDGKLSLQPDTILARLHGIRPNWDQDGQTGGWKKPGLLLAFNPLRVLRMLFNIGAETVAEVLALGFSRCGPLVAIGRPGDALALPGADQMFVTDERWQDVVLEYVRRSQAVILVPSNTPGVRWEIDQVFAEVPRQRILLYMSAFHGQAGEYELFRDRMRDEHGLRLPDVVPRTDLPCFVYFEPDGTARVQEVCLRSPILWPLTGNAVDTRRTFRSFIQGLAGGDRAPPAQPKPHHGHGLPSLLTAAAVVGAIVFLPALWAYASFHAKRGVDTAQRQVAEVVRDTPLAAVVPVDDPAAGTTTTYTGTRMRYEFRLGSAWKREPIPPGKHLCEHHFSYRGTIGFVAIDVADDLFGRDDQVGDTMRELVETGLRRELGPGVTVTLVHARTVRANGVEWSDVKLTRRLGGNEQLQRVRVYRSFGQSVMASVILPNDAVYDRFADQFFAALKITESPSDRLLREARAGASIKYDGKAMRYTFALPAVWKAEPIDPMLIDKLTTAAKQAGVPVQMPEHHFVLRASGAGDARDLGGFGVEIADEELDIELLDEIVENQLQKNRDGLRAAFGPEVEITVVGSRRLTIRGREWGEYEFRIGLAGKGVGFSMLNRFTSYRGRTAFVSARLQSPDPVVRQLAVEALDTVSVARIAPPAADRSWTGKTVVLSRGAVLARPRPVKKGDELIELRGMSYPVLADAGGRLQVRDGGKDVWFDKDDAVLSENAVAYFTGRIEEDAKDEFAHFGRAVAWNLRGETDKAVADYAVVLRLNPSNGGARYNRGMLYYQKSDYARAADDFDAAAKLMPDDPDVFFERGRARYSLGRYGPSADDYTAAVRLGKRDAVTFNNRGLAREMSREYDLATADYTEAIRLDPKYIDAWLNRADMNRIRGKHADAIPDYTAALKLKADHAGTLVSRAICWDATAEYSKAAADCTAAIKIDPKNALAFRTRGDAWRHRGDQDAAVDDYSEALRLDARDVTTLIHRGVSWDAKGDYTKAAADFTTAIQIDPKNALAFNNRGLMRRNLGELVLAVEDHDEAIRLSPKYAVAFYHRGGAQEARKKYAAAAADYAEAVRLDPNLIGALRDQAALLATGPDVDVRDGEAAVAAAAKANQLAGGKNPDDFALLAAAHAQAGDYDEAVKWQKKALADPVYAARNKADGEARLELYEGGRPYRRK